MLAGCGSRPPEPVQGEAFVGPMKLQLWAALAPRAPITATLKQGERVDILGVRRRFVHVRSATGAEGWTESEFLLSRAQVDAYRQVQESLRDAPSMGQAIIYDPLNIHIAPYRQAPSFAQIPESGKVEIIGHCVSPRGSYEAPSQTKSQPESEDESAGPDANETVGGVPVPPPPPPPVLPENWLRLSRPRLQELEGDASAGRSEQEEDEDAPVPSDDWYLVRTPEGRVGWTLARRLFMAVPDEVAQYAEGHRITSYFAVGEVTDDGKRHASWLWTTLGAYDVPYQFDTIRYFVWSRRRHRYETSFIQRRLQGYYPVRVVKSKAGVAEGFSAIVRDQEGGLESRTYQFHGDRLRLASRMAYTKPVNAYPKDLIPEVAPLEPGQKSGPGFWKNLWSKAKLLFSGS